MSIHANIDTSDCTNNLNCYRIIFPLIFPLHIQSVRNNNVPEFHFSTQSLQSHETTSSGIVPTSSSDGDQNLSKIDELHYFELTVIYQRLTAELITANRWA